jgi:pyruvate,water dikinase
LPQVEQMVRHFEAFDPGSVEQGQWARVLAQQEGMYWRVFSGVHRNGPVLGRQAFAAFASAFQERFGNDRTNDAHALVLGTDNCALQRAAALWDLGRLLRASPELLEAQSIGAPMPDTAAARAFNERFAAMIAVYGHTSNSDCIDLPFWREDYDIPLAIITAYAHHDDGASPTGTLTRQRQQRGKLEEELSALAAAGDVEVAHILKLLPAAQELVPNSEDHNFLADQRQMAASRQRWMKIGGHLVGLGLLDGADDIFFLQQRELLQVLEGVSRTDRGVLAERKHRHLLARASRPPSVLGKPLVGEESSNQSNLESDSSVRVLKGMPASPGSVRGRARLVETTRDGASLVSGDILVTRSTTPSWSPFFAVASGLVTNSGGTLSHAAVVAREFGIPAVVGVVNATELISDGATIILDGTRGIVIMES